VHLCCVPDGGQVAVVRQPLLLEHSCCIVVGLLQVIGSCSGLECCTGGRS